MKISFVIPAYNEEHGIGRCLDAVLAAIKNTPCDAEVIVVNNASTDNTQSVVSRYSGVRIVDEKRKGLVWARKAGYAASTGDVIANIDADTQMPEKWLPRVLAEFSNDPRLMALSGPYIYFDTPWYVQASTWVFYTVGYVFDKINQLFTGSGSMLQGGNFVLRREALEKIGGFDTSIEFYGEDTDIGRRVGRIGKVKWTYGLPMYSSGRRFVGQGLIKTGWLYAMNFIWITFLKKPFNSAYTDIRADKKT